jgi:site-specific DNA recombinase
MRKSAAPHRLEAARRCAIYTRVSTDHGLEQDFNSLDAQREACEAYVKSQAHEGSGGSMDRPALQQLIEIVRNRRIDVVVVYKVDRLTRSLTDFAKLVELFDQHSVSFDQYGPPNSQRPFVLCPIRM